MIVTLLLLVAGFALLVKGADWLVKGGSSLGRRLGVSDLVIGLTVVAFGTSMPELFVNLLAGLRGNTDIAIGNVLGSNICNILLILGTAAAVFPLTVSAGTVWREIPFCLLAVLTLAAMANDTVLDGADRSVLSRSEGLILLGLFAVFLYYSAAIAQQSPPSLIEKTPTHHMSTPRAGLAILGGIATLALGGHWCVSGAIYLAQRLQVSESLIGLTVVAVGTSLPELATSLVAAFRKNCDIAVGNVVGSNLFNVFFILGVSALVRPLPLATQGNIDIAVVTIATVILFLCMFVGKRRIIDRWEGCLMVAGYGLYTVYLVYRG